VQLTHEVGVLKPAGSSAGGQYRKRYGSVSKVQKQTARGFAACQTPSPQRSVRYRQQMRQQCIRRAIHSTAAV
jgi:hypothetical protein